MTIFDKIFLLGVGFSDVNEHEVLEFIITGLPNQSEKYYVVTPNPELLVIANNDSRYRTILNNAKIALPDGIGVMIASKIMGKPLKERIHGVDLVKMLCREVSKKPITVGFLGAGPNVAIKTAKCLREKYPDLKVGFTETEWDFEKKYPAIDILFVAFGSPKQEIWISENLNVLPAKVVIGVGGAFDFISGKVKRAPVIVRKIGLEWLFRLIIQPWRIKRQLKLIQFMHLVAMEKLGIRKSSL
jgi:N-acetylglucosaminyldiphosphoundecaprenol N-acetyl-beta-D-mannosaminyltransferase